MPAVFVVVPEYSVVLTRGWGNLTGAELHAHARALAACPEFQPAFRQLADLRGVRTLVASTDDVRKLADLNPFVPRARRAVLAATDVVFGMARMYQSHLDGPGDSLRVCRHLEDALRWLDLSEALNTLEVRWPPALSAA